MYRQIRLDPTQTSLHRVVWREDPSHNIKIGELLTLTYGTASASAIATESLEQLAKSKMDKYPKGAIAVLKGFYMDDFVYGEDDEEEVLKIHRQVTALLAEGGFRIRKWASNSSGVLKEISQSSSKDYLLELDKDGAAKTLGVVWNPSKDVFLYRISIKASATQSHTKRSILSQIAQIFDPLGLLGPVIITAKILMQRLWKMKIDWNETLPRQIRTEWSTYIHELQDLEKISIPRKIVRSGQGVRKEIHGFCDASEHAYGACVYMRSIGTDGVAEVHLICAKSRVAPLKVLSTPRLELQGAELLSELMEKVANALEGKIEEKFYWTDAKIVLYWIQASNKKLPVFVAHRVGSIQERTAVDNWRHVGSKENPADLISRGISAKELMHSQLWWEGPQWLRCNDLPESQQKVTEYDESQLAKNDRARVVTVASCQETSPFYKFSTFTKVIRIAATCLRFVHNCKRQKHYGPLTVDELEEATKCLIRREQAITFSKDIQDLTRQGTVSNQSSLKHLTPFIDEENLIRVGGRLQHANLRSDVKHPWLLLQRSKVTELIIEHEHRKLMHAGSEATLAAMRLRYWSPKARGTIRRVLRRCIRCFKAKPKFSEQLMGDLPTHRVIQSRPFSHTGVDFCGPIYVREGSRKNA
ncbi:uncharacterized protein LOC112453047 [Temnothorax curvispinosus]|uniref:Uncharacterized protein LOC112453047 n=1 Tax=Temnothorax curvispinosus TaxID=300111 RepID=A0A6J1PJ79_9HYME|nr:uncharacterized protein LOC112453047 [Temnothorax curvispinosus]